MGIELAMFVCFVMFYLFIMAIYQHNGVRLFLLVQPSYFLSCNNEAVTLHCEGSMT